MSTTSYDDILLAAAEYYGRDSDEWRRITDWTYAGSRGLADRAKLVSEVPGVTLARNANGDVIGYNLANTFESSFNPPAVVDSNVPNASYSSGSSAFKGNINATYEVIDDTVTPPRGAWVSGAKRTATGTKVATVTANVFNSVGAAMLGAKLGKAINSSFGGEYAWNESDWSDWVSGLDPLDKAVFRTLFDIDDNGNTTAYLPEEMLASMFKMYQDMGVFDDADVISDNTDVERTSTILYDPTNPYPTSFLVCDGTKTKKVTASGYTYTVNITSHTQPVTTVTYYYSGNDYYYPIIFSAADFSGKVLRDGAVWTNIRTTRTTLKDGTVVFYSTSLASDSVSYVYPSPSFNLSDMPVMDHVTQDVISLIIRGTTTEIPPVEGITNDPRASTQIDPNVITGTTPQTILPQLKQNYPQLFGDSIYEDVPQDDGSIKRITYIPVPWPTKDSQGDPITGTSSQDNPKVDPLVSTPTETETLTDTIIGSPTGSPTDTSTIEPPPTGIGTSPTNVLPVGSASSLWKIYNPTQAQLDAFGSWLWDSSFVEQIKKLFNDPMQAIIGVHKVFATPSIGGTATIKVGYLDSQVPSDWVDSQYTTINCGSVNVREYFGNVFDYHPYTRVSLYLPFIGIVDLDVADVLRGTVKVVYHVDVLTGACLADVIVTRDNAGGVIYQYSGSAIVTYPVSSGNYMGMVAGVLSVASGIAGTVLSGGALAPALIGGAVGASHLHTDVSKSGGFSGCAGAMGAKKPYLIISRPQTAMADNYEHFTGKPANAHVTLKNCGGMTRVKSVYVGNMNATDEEKNLIEAQLKNGVLV